MSDWYTSKPWLARYEKGQPSTQSVEFPTMLDAFKSTVARTPEADSLVYFDRRITFRELDQMSDGFAVALQDWGMNKGDRVALYLQNVPQFVIAMVGAWKAGCAVVSINPMNRRREVTELLKDSGARVLVTLEELHLSVSSEVISCADGLAVERIVTTSELDFQIKGDHRVLGGITRSSTPDAVDLLELIAGNQGLSPEQVELSADDIAFLTYTSGTTGPPKGAITTHANLVFNSQSYRTWAGLSDRDVVLGIAPLFHITGLVAHISIALLIGAPLVLMCRFDSDVVLETIDREGATFTVASITAFIALMNAPGAASASLSSMRTVFSGGAPIPPSTVRAFSDQFGVYIHNIYGMTETTSPSHAVPVGADAPVDPGSGALSVGVPIYDTIVRVVDEDGNDLPPGEVGEFVTAGPQVTRGYWNKPEETAAALKDGYLRTGDVGYMDAEGWFYVVDRMKDQINAGGYKVWPREVEDVLYEHPAVREVAVVGVADEYRGETVKAFVSLVADQTVSADELIAFSRERLAAYKYPREIEFLEEIPKTTTGKILRRSLKPSTS
jgi:long-chain acyl-CoA synthetase